MKINIFNTNCYDFMRTIADNSVNLIYTDPPYDVGIMKRGSGGTINNLGKFDESLEVLNKITNTGYDLKRFCDEAMRIMKDINIYVWCNKKQIPEYLHYFVDEQKALFDILVWHKTNCLPNLANKYLTDCEYCLYFHSKGKCYPKSYEDGKTVYISPINRENKIYGHPTIKPLPFVRSMIRNSAREGDVVFDPFMGSGTTGVACKELSLDFIGCEINQTFFNVARDRINGTIKNKKVSKNILR